MFWKLLGPSLAVVAISVCTGHAVDIELVHVGNPLGAGVNYEYFIGKYEVTNAQWCEFLNAKARTGNPHGIYNGKMADTFGGISRDGSGTTEDPYMYSVKDGDTNWANRPVNWVSLWDAARFCNWLHNGKGDGDTETGAYANIGNAYTFARQPGAVFFIPTEQEWCKAAYHKNDGVTDNYFGYPTSSDTKPSNNFVDPDPGNHANYRGISSDDYTLGGPYWTTEVGEFENSASPYGTFDQGGNVWEWNENLIQNVYRPLRGGCWAEHGPALSDLHRSNRAVVYPDHEREAIGFRIASIPALVPGDLDGDGIVASHDLDIVRLWWLYEVEPGDLIRGDATGDGLVNSADLDVVRRNWGAGIATVPEPGAVLQVLVGFVVVTFRRRR